MIDIHSHILPNVDDGARHLQQSLDMLKIAIDSGVTTQVLTPHIQRGRYDNTKQLLTIAFNQFKEQVDKHNLPVTLLLSAEMHIGPELMPWVTSDQVPWLGEHQQMKTMLLEFPRTEVPFGSDNLVKWLISNHCLPIIVHPERNTTFLNQRHKLQTFIDLGCPLQVTASSLTGKFGAQTQSMSEQLIISGEACCIASDCHNLKGRAPDLAAGYEQAQRLIGKENADDLVYANPLALINNNHFYKSNE